jgi:hypothetical protein
VIVLKHPANLSQVLHEMLIAYISSLIEVMQIIFDACLFFGQNETFNSRLQLDDLL